MSETSEPRVLRLTLKRRWFDMVACGQKLEEYRSPSQWIESRLRGKSYDLVEFKNGYGPNVPCVTVEFKGWHIGHGHESWGATPGWSYFVIQLGEIVSTNFPPPRP